MPDIGGVYPPPETAAAKRMSVALNLGGERTRQLLFIAAVAGAVLVGALFLFFTVASLLSPGSRAPVTAAGTKPGGSSADVPTGSKLAGSWDLIKIGTQIFDAGPAAHRSRVFREQSYLRGHRGCFRADS